MFAAGATTQRILYERNYILGEEGGSFNHETREIFLANVLSDYVCLCTCVRCVFPGSPRVCELAERT